MSLANELQKVLHGVGKRSIVNKIKQIMHIGMTAESFNGWINNREKHRNKNEHPREV